MSYSQEKMSCELLDLDINKYTVSDLERFFKLNYSVAPYTADDVQYKEYVIREELMKNVQTNKKFKSELVTFLEKAKRIIILAKCPTNALVPTSIPNNFRLDPTPDYPLPSLSLSRNEELVVPTYIKPIHATNGNQYYNGTINPIETRLKTTNLCIDTLFRKNYFSTKSTDFTYFLPKIINNVVSLKMSSFEFPLLWNTFTANDKNNVMYVSLYNMQINGEPIPDVVDFEIIIPDGNYTQNTFIQTVNNIFTSRGDIGLDFLWCEVDTVTNSTVFRARNFYSESVIGLTNSFPFYNVDSQTTQYSPDFYFTIDFSLKNDMYMRPTYKNLGWILGFRDTFYTVTPANTVTSYTALLTSKINYTCYLRSESIFGNNLNSYFFIEVDDFQNNFPTDNIIATNDSYGNYLGKNIIARCIIGGNAGVNLTDNGADLTFKKRDYFGPVNIEKLKIRILNRYGDVIDTNKSDFSITFEITTVNMNG